MTSPGYRFQTRLRCPGHKYKRLSMLNGCLFASDTSESATTPDLTAPSEIFVDDHHDQRRRSREGGKTVLHDHDYNSWASLTIGAAWSWYHAPKMYFY
jgi:hypothetical protein